MSRNIIIWLGAAMLLAACTSTPDTADNGKKVYADYHGVRYTREHDGKLGRWEMYADTYQSATGRKTLCYNADLIDSLGRHDIAATAYPLTGMQSNLDEDYLEYQILQAKTALIDGFFIEWGFLPHENDLLLKAMQKVAAKYDFEVGVNWCDGWLYYNWITKIYPEINSRETKTDYMAECYQYLIDSVFNAPTAPLVKGYPVFYHFGPGATVEEFARVKSAVQLPEGMPEPVALRRWADWGTLENDSYVPVTQSDEMDAWAAAGEIPAPWIPARVRPMDEKYPYWDNYAETRDLIEFMKPFRDSIWLSDRASYVVKSGFAMPGMDNSGCAGWGRGHFFYIPRHEGQTYRQMWDFCMESADSLDMMFIASWSDYTEGHEIEPTVENGYREVLTTLEYAAGFKGLEADESGVELPLRLFKARKSCRFLESCGADVTAAMAGLDEAAKAVSKAEYSRAGRVIESVEKFIAGLEKGLQSDSLVYEDCGRNIRLPEETVELLKEKNFSCTLEFEYLDAGREYLFVRSAKSARDGSEVMGKLRTDDSGEWKKACMEVSKALFDFSPDKNLLSFGGDVEIRNIKLTFTVYSM